MSADMGAEFWTCSIMFRKLIENAGPTTMEDALSCLHGMVNTAEVRLNQLGGQHVAKAHVAQAWVELYDASKKIEP